jgi:hypothetical protein
VEKPFDQLPSIQRSSDGSPAVEATFRWKRLGTIEHDSTEVMDSLITPQIRIEFRVIAWPHFLERGPQGGPPAPATQYLSEVRRLGLDRSLPRNQSHDQNVLIESRPMAALPIPNNS